MKRSPHIHLLLFILLVTIPSFSKNGLTIGVANFTNIAKEPTMAFLSKTLAESFSTALSQIEPINVVDRYNIEHLLNEQALAHIGLVGDTVPDLSFVNAQYIAVGSYTGNTSYLTLSIKLIEVVSSKVVVQKELSGSMDDLFSQMYALANHFYYSLTDDNSITLNITSEPDIAKVYINNTWAGVTPLHNFKTEPGSLKISVKIDGYYENEIDTTLENGSKASIHTTLEPSSFQNETSLKTGIRNTHYISDYYNYHNEFHIALRHRLNHHLINLEYFTNAFDKTDHSYSINRAGVDIVKEVRFQSYHGASLSYGYSFLTFNRYIRVIPFLGLSHIWLTDGIDEYVQQVPAGDKAKKWSSLEGYYTDSPFPHSTNLYVFTSNVEMLLFPKSTISLFIDAHYRVSFSEMTRTSVIEDSLFENESYENKKLRFAHYALGVGVCINFGEY